MVPLRDPKRLDDAGLLKVLLAGEVLAPAAFFGRFCKHVERRLTRIFGADADVSDLVNETFYRALNRIEQVQDTSGFKAWLTSIAVFVAREHLRHARRRRWLQFWESDKVPAPAVPAGDHEGADAVRRLYGVLMTACPRTSGSPSPSGSSRRWRLSEVASACGVSLATIKRTLARAETRFVARARRDALLRDWLEGSARWSDR